MKLFFPLLLGLLVVMASCSKKELVTPSGYKYVHHIANKTGFPQPGDVVYFHAQMRNADSVVTKSRDFPDTPNLQIALTEEPGRELSPVEEVLKVMSVGDSATIFISIDTLPQKPQGFENAKEVLYDLVVIKIVPKAEFEAEMAMMQMQQQAEAEMAQARFADVEAMVPVTLKDYKAGKLASTLKTTASGLKYVVHEEGTGAQAEAGKTVSVHYYGVLASDGTPFDNSFARGAAFTFPLGQGQVIPGWDEGLALLKEGSKATFFIPAALAYGEMGAPPTIPANSELLFYVELNKVQ